MTEDKLTDEHREIIDAAYKEWLEAGLSTAPADFDSAEDAVASLYKRIGKERPHFVRLSSPFAAVLYVSLLTNTGTEFYKQFQLRDQLGGQLWLQLWEEQLRNQLRGRLREQLRDRLWGQLRDQFECQLRAQLRDPLGEQLRDQLWSCLVSQLRGQLEGQLRDRVGHQPWRQLWGRLRGQLDDQLRRQLKDEIRNQLWDQLRDTNLTFSDTSFYGQWDAGFWGWGDAGRKLGAIYPEDLNDALNDHCVLCRSVGWIYPFTDFCILTDRPEKIATDEQFRLHCENGPTLLYRDGYALYAWHGVRVPEEWIVDRDSLTPHLALTHKNTELRRTACEILGWETILRELNAVTIEKDDDPQIGELVEVENPETGKERFLRVECGTGRIFAMPVPPDMTTALQANAWTWGLEADQYKPEVRT